MNSIALLKGQHLQTYHRLFQQPTLYNIEWRQVSALLRDICNVEEKPNGSLRFTRNGQTLLLRTPLTKELSDIDELNAVRDFLVHAEESRPEAGQPTTHWVMVIDHHQARIFTSDQSGTCPIAISPPQATDHFRHTADSNDFSHSWEPHGQNAFFAIVAKAVREAPHLLIMGTGTGAGSCMLQFITWVKSHHPDLAGKIVGTVTVDEQHMTDDQLLASARKYFIQHHVA